MRAEIILVELGVFVHRAGEKALAERAVGTRPMPSSSQAFRIAVGFRSARPERIFVLQRGDRLHGMRAPNRLRARLGQTEMLDLAFRDQFLHRAGNVLDRHIGIDAVLIEQIDHVRPKPLQRFFRDLADMLRPAVQASLLVRLRSVEAEFGGDDDLLADRPQRLADHLFVGEWSIDFRRVEEGDASSTAVADQRDALLLVERQWP